MKVHAGWYKQEIRALNYQINEEIVLIERTKKRIQNVKNGGKDLAGCDLEYLKKLLIRLEEERGTAKKQKEVFEMLHTPSEKIKTDKKGAEQFIKNNAYKVKGAEMYDQFNYYGFLTTVAKLYGLLDREDDVIDWYFNILDKELNRLADEN